MILLVSKYVLLVFKYVLLTLLSVGLKSYLIKKIWHYVHIIILGAT